MGDSTLAGSVHECGRPQEYQNSGCSFISSGVASVSAGGNRAPTTVGSLQDQSPELTHQAQGSREQILASRRESTQAHEGKQGILEGSPWLWDLRKATLRELLGFS